MNTLKEKETKAFATLKEKLGLKNVMQVPRVLKVVVSAGVGSIKDKKKIELVADRLTKITGQKIVTKGAKKSIASFKVRQGDTSGYQVTLRGDRMRGFLDKLLNVSLPRTKDFRGISVRSIDDVGNITIGIKEHTIFPETADEELKDVFGLAVTVVTSANSREQAKTFFEYLNFPFKRNEEMKKPAKKDAKRSRKPKVEAK
ncbi:MAG: 50S ribosomal protein L5 [Candidatus Taylorbacteria bacterium]